MPPMLLNADMVSKIQHWGKMKLILFGSVLDYKGGVKEGLHCGGNAQSLCEQGLSNEWQKILEIGPILSKSSAAGSHETCCKQKPDLYLCVKSTL